VWCLENPAELDGFCSPNCRLESAAATRAALGLPPKEEDN
jgi:hypothetical protein